MFLVVAVTIIAIVRAPSDTEIRQSKPTARFEPSPEPLSASPASLPTRDAVETPQPVATDLRLNLNELRDAVQSGNSFDVQALQGKPAADDAAAIHDLLAEIPESASEVERDQIVSKLMDMLRRTPGDEVSRLLLAVLQREGALTFMERHFTAMELGRRHFQEAVPFLETWAFPGPIAEVDQDAQSRASLGASALLELDPQRYLLPVLRLATSSPVSALWVYVGSLDGLASQGHPSVGVLIPWLQDKYRATATESTGGYTLLEVVVSYAVASKSDMVRSWALSEAEARLNALKARTKPSDLDGLEIYERLYSYLVKELEKSDE